MERRAIPIPGAAGAEQPETRDHNNFLSDSCLGLLSPEQQEEQQDLCQHQELL